MSPVTRYAKSDDVYIAYQTFGEGSLDLVLVPGFISNIETYWDDPRSVRWLNGLSRFARVTMFDKRGTGLSDRVAELPHMEVRMDDMRAVMDAVGIEQAAVMGISEGGSLATLFAAHHQHRCQALILYGAFARFTSWFPTDDALKQFIGYIDSDWGAGGIIQMVAPSLAHDSAYVEWMGKFERQGASPSAVKALMHMNSQIDISDVLSSVHVPTLVIHKSDDGTVDVAGGRDLAAGIPNARYFEFPGADHLPWYDDCDIYISEIEAFLTGSRYEPVVDRVLTTVLFTDIVDSTRQADMLGDRAWRDVSEAHDQAFRKHLDRFRGTEVKSLGDGFLATFDGPARAVRCAQAVRDEVARLGVQIRAGAHTGEVQLVDDDVLGISVNIASRVAALSPAEQVTVTRTVKDLVAGSGLAFDDFGEHVLKGVPDTWHLFAARESR